MFKAIASFLLSICHGVVYLCMCIVVYEKTNLPEGRNVD